MERRARVGLCLPCESSGVVVSAWMFRTWPAIRGHRHKFFRTGRLRSAWSMAQKSIDGEKRPSFDHGDNSIYVVGQPLITVDRWRQLGMKMRTRKSGRAKPMKRCKICRRNWFQSPRSPANRPVRQERPPAPEAGEKGQKKQYKCHRDRLPMTSFQRSGRLPAKDGSNG